MAGFRLFTSNRLEILAEALAETLRAPLKSPLDREIIVVQSQGMARWLSMELARHHGVAANYDFPFPNRFIRDIFRRVIPDLKEGLHFEPAFMTWRIMRCLVRLRESPGFEDIKDYVQAKERDVRLLQISERIADTFDQYLLYRPDMIFAWEKGKETHWQAVLWRELTREVGPLHRAALAREFFRAIRRRRGVIKDLPERVSVFGISSLPPFHVEVLSKIVPFTRVNVFLMNPCEEYWGDILTDWEMRRVAPGRFIGPSRKKDLHMEKGNSLLASMGRLGRDFLNVFTELETEDAELFRDPGERDLLCCIQSDILNLRERGSGQSERKVISTDDESVRIHSCHSPMREVEVLYDQILSMSERDPTLEPKDILVMAPDIETYAPYIQAVFDVPEKEHRRIPYTIADRSIRSESEVINPFLGILDLAGGRMGAFQVLAILESRPVLRKFGLRDTDMQLIRKWIGDTRIRWGVDEKSREGEGLPVFRDNSWRGGIERLLLGYAMAGRNERLFRGILPYDDMEGTETEILGGLVEFAEKLFALVDFLKERRKPGDWGRLLSSIMDEFFEPDEETERDFEALRDVAGDFQVLEELGPLFFQGELDVNAVKWYMDNSLQRKGFGYGFISGGVTFCALLPMRSIPFKVICLLGMDGDAYPRESQHLSFDLAKSGTCIRKCTRSRDRYLIT